MILNFIRSKYLCSRSSPCQKNLHCFHDRSISSRLFAFVSGTKRKKNTVATRQIQAEVKKPVNIGSCEVDVGASIGIALYPDSGDTAERMVKAADVAMYEAKKRGGGRFQYYSPSLNKKLEQREAGGRRHAAVLGTPPGER